MARKMDADDTSAASAGSENSYLALRAAKIARNEARLRELGLLGPLVASVAAPASSSAQQTKKKPAPPKREKKGPSVSAPPVRWSTRTSKGQAPPPLTFVSPESHLAVEKKRPRTGPSKATSSEPRARSFSSSASAPARELRLNISKLLLGDGEGGLLGWTLPDTGKAAVMRAAAARAAENAPGGAADVSFNKYSGVQEWQNCLFLWVNFGSPDAQAVVNEFFDAGRQISWFGGSKMHPETAVIKKLQHPNFKGRMILWCREYCRDAKCFRPYTCLGRLELVSYNSQTQPLEFVFRLMDFERMVEQAPDRKLVVRMMKQFGAKGAFL